MYSHETSPFSKGDFSMASPYPNPSIIAQDYRDLYRERDFLNFVILSLFLHQDLFIFVAVPKLLLCPPLTS
jgi:hypothetical protein